MEILKRALSALLVMVLVCGMLPMSMTAGATETEPLSETLPAVTEETTVPETTAAAVETIAAEETIPETTAAVEEAPSREGQTPQEPVTYYWYVTSEEKSKTETTQIVEQDAGGIFHSHDEKQTVTATVKELNEVYMNPVSTLSLGEDEYGGLTFTTFADLQELASRTYSDWTFVYYTGRDALTIEESLTLPEQLCLYFYEDNSKVIVPEGVTLRVNSTMVVDTLVVEGVVVANNYGCLRVQKELKITGEIKLNTPIYVSASAAITGAENIHPQNEWTTVYVSHDQLANAADLEAAVQIAENDRSGWIHTFEVSTYMTGALVLDRSLTLPANSELILYGEDSITIAEGCTLTLNCEYANSDVPLIVKGALVNNCSNFYLYSPVTFAETGSYSGTGMLHISKDFFGQPADAVPGLDMAGVIIIGEGEWGGFWTVQDAASVTKLATPKDLQWNKGLFYGNEQPTLVDAYGNVAWKAVRPDLNSASIRFYKVGDSEPWSSHSWWFDDYEGEIWRSIDGFATDDPESGTYYFTVQSTTDRAGYANSDIAVSDTWTYTKPSAQLANCTGLYWDGNTARWSAPSNADETTRFAIEFYYADSLDTTPDSCGRSWGFFYPYAAISEEGYAYRGPGYYFFKVRALSGDITEICNGEWSEMSAPLYFDADSSTEPTPPTEPGIDDNPTTGMTQDELEAILAEAAASGADYTLCQEVILERDLAIDCCLNMGTDGYLVVPEDVTLTINGQLYIWNGQALQNDGTVEINGYLGMFGTLTNNGAVKLATGGTAEIFGTWDGSKPVVENTGTSGTCGENLSWSFSAATGTLTISGSGAMESYNPHLFGVYSVAPWAHLSALIRNVVIDDAVTCIGSNAFYGCDNLADVKLSDSVMDLAYAAFASCTGLQSVEIPTSVTDISYFAFADCTSLQEITFTGNAPSIGADAFLSVTSNANYPANDATWTADVMQNYGGALTWIPYGEPTIPTSGTCGEKLTWEFDEATGTLTISGTGAMYDRSDMSYLPWGAIQEKILHIQMDDAITHISDWVFSGCANLKSVHMPENLEVIGSYAFCMCRSLDAIELPDSVMTMAYAAFAYCDSLVKVELSQNLESIADYAFAECDSLESIMIPTGVNVGGYAFGDCSSLHKVIFGGDAPEIGEAAFHGVFANAYYPSNNPTWTNEVMQDYGGYAIVWLPYGDAASGKCGDNLTWQFDAFNNTLTISGSGDMYDYLMEGKMDYGYPWEKYRNDIYKIQLPDGLTGIGDNAFCNCINLQSIELPESLQRIGSYAFACCSALAEIAIPDGVAEIGDMAFFYCDNLVKINIPERITEIKYGMLGCCAKLESIVIPHNVQKIWDGAFSDCTALKDITFVGNMPEFVQQDIGNQFFGVKATAYYPANNYSWPSEGMQNYGGDITWIPYEAEIPTSGTCGGNLTWEFDPETGTLTISGIGEMWNFIASLLQRSADPVVPWAAFQSDIKQVILPEGLTSVGNNAFNGCENLTGITIPATVVTIGTSAFRNSGLTAITFEGDAPAEIGEAAFENVTATVSYPEDNETWTEDKLQNYGGEITWGTESAHEYQLGDVNHDGKINAKDSTLILQYSVGVLKDTTKFCETCANVNGDSKLNAKDATMILQYSVGLRTSF